MWSLTLRLREAGMATLCCKVATAQPPSHASAVWRGGEGGGSVSAAPVCLWQAVTAARRWIYKVASYSISPSCFYIQNCLCHKQLMDEGGKVYEPRLPQRVYLFYSCFVVCWSSSYFHLLICFFSVCVFAGSSSNSSWSVTRTAWRMQGTLETWGDFRWATAVRLQTVCALTVDTPHCFWAK